MKRKFWVYMLSLALAVSAVCGFGAALAADAPTEEMRIQSVQCTNIAGGYGEGIAVIPDPGVSMGYWGEELEKTNIAIRDPYGDAVTIHSVEKVNTQFGINRSKGYPPKGSVITFKAGFFLQEVTSKNVFGGILKADQSFIYLEGEYGVWDAFAAAESLTLDANEATVQVGGEAHAIVATLTGETNAYLTYRSADEGIAKVSASGEVTGVAEGSTTITVTSGFLQQTLTVTVEPAGVPQSAIRVTNPDKTISAYVGEDYDLSELNVVAVYGDKDGAAITVTGDMISGTVDKNTVGKYTLTVTSGTFTDTFTVVIVERPAMTVKDVNYLPDWECIFVSFNEDFLSNYDAATAVKIEGISIRRRDGTSYQVTAVALLGSQMLIREEKTEEISGDILTIEKNFRIIGSDGSFEYPNELKEDAVYVCPKRGTPYEVFEAAETFTVAPDSVEVQPAGKTAELTVTVKNGNGLVTFVTGDRDLARVSDGTTVAGEDGTNITKATVTGVAEGETTVKIVCGFLEKTVKVKVLEPAEQPNGIKITTKDKTIVAYPGYEYDLTELTAEYTYASGAEGLPVDITPDMVTGKYEKDVVGSYKLTLTVGEFTDDFTVQVTAVPGYTIQIQPDKTEPLPGGDFGSNSGYGDFYFIGGLDGGSTEYYDLPADQLASVKSHFYLNGKNDVLNACKYFNSVRYEFYFTAAAKNMLKPGDVLKLAKGLPMWSYTGTASKGQQINGDGKFVLLGVLEDDLNFIYAGTGWVLYKQNLVPTDFTLSSSSKELSVGAELGLDYKMVPATAYGTPAFTSSDTTIATVDYLGRVVAVKEGKVTITAKLGDKTHTVELTVVPAKAVKGIELVGTYVSYWIVKDSKGEDFKPKFKQARPIFENDSYGTPFELAAGSYKLETLDTSKVGEGKLKVTITYEGKDYETFIDINIYEYYDQVVDQVAIVGWYEYAVFVQFLNTSSNDVNLTDSGSTKGILDKVHYTRKDGTEIEIGYYLLNNNLALLPEFLTGPDGKHQINADNYNEFYLEGDTITIEEGMPMYKWTGRKKVIDSNASAIEQGTGEAVIEGYLKKTVQYVYNGSVWSLYLEYTDIEASSPEMTLKINEKKSAGVYRVPDDATTGTFRYESSDPGVVTVSPTGVLQGKKAGAASIKVTLSGGKAGDKSATIQVTVIDYVLDKLALEPLTLDSVPYADTLDLGNVKAYLQWASGTRGEEVSLEGATVAGFNKDAEGEQTVTVSVTVSGKTYVGVLTIASVERPKRGCGGAADGTCGALLGGVLLAAGALALVKRRTRG